MAAIQQLIRKADEPETYHGFPVLHLRVGDAIPTPRIPERYAVRVTPDLARYWLNECNHPDQRRVREGKVSVFSEDTYAARLQEAKAKWAKQIEPKARKIQEAIQKWNQEHRDKPLNSKDLLAPLVAAGALTQEDLKDPWGTPFGIAPGPRRL